jgi:glycosyltransferase involved in cell wall biosynthesis
LELSIRETSPSVTKVLYIQQNTRSFAGVEHVVDTICSELARRYQGRIEVDVLYTSTHQSRPAEKPAYHEITCLTHGRLDLLRACRDVVKSKDYALVVVPQIEPAAIVMLACLGIPRKFAVYLHGNPHREQSHWKARILFFLMRNYFLRNVTGIFGTSPKQLESFRIMFNSQVQQTWLPNPVRRFELDDRKVGGPSGEVTFVNVGRFAYQKGQDILLAAFAEVSRLRSNVRLKLVGYGADEVKLREQVALLKLEDLVSFEHLPDSPLPALATSDIFVSTSRWEGWSLAICEALRCGLPVISTDCEFGPSDILIDRRLGQLVAVDDRDALVAAMLHYADHLEEERSHFEYRKDYVSRFDVERVVDVHASALIAAAGHALADESDTRSPAPAEVTVARQGIEIADRPATRTVV